MIKKMKVFLSYSHADEKYKEELDKHFAALKRSDKVETWNDREMAAGTRFDDDIKNHLTVLAGLLKAGEDGKAEEYLEKLGDISAGLSYPVWTGNVTVDALLGSKCSLARQKGIDVQCEIKLPKDTGIEDIDWCIVFSNAVDNAIKACEDVENGERYIRISNRRKGNFYGLSIENSCRKDMEKVPEEGIGLFNIRSVAQKNRGTVETAVSKGVYKLKILFIIVMVKKLAYPIM